MKFSESWLRSFVDPAIEGEAFSHLLTMAGLEVEEEESVAPAFAGVVVAHVLEVNKHPDADRLNVCRVDIGTGTPQQIVCGAPNVAPGLKVPCALPGAVLPGEFTIKIAKVRGIESSGMLCSAKELGIAEDASGLLVLPADAPVGEDIRHYLDLDDCLRTLKLTPNRADCLSLTGIAREVAALTGTPASFPEVAPTPVSIDRTRAIVLDAPEACPLYCGRVIAGVNAKAPTPEWMKRRLERSGIRCEACNNFFPGRIRLTGPDVDEQAVRAYYAKALERAATLGVKSIVFGSAGAKRVPEGFDMDRAYQQVVQVTRETGEAAAKYGITIVLIEHDMQLVMSLCDRVMVVNFGKKLAEGVPEEVILREDGATFTYQNAINSRKVTDAVGIRVKKAIICCKAQHARRCKLYYQYLYPQTTFLICPSDVGINRENWFDTQKGRKEVLGEVEKCGEQLQRIFCREADSWSI